MNTEKIRLGEFKITISTEGLDEAEERLNEIEKQLDRILEKQEKINTEDILNN